MGCIDTIAAPIYTGADNIISLVLFADGKVLSDLSAVTRVVVEMREGITTDADGNEVIVPAGQIIDSDIVGGGVIWWTDQQEYRGQMVDVLRLQLGDQGLTEASYPEAIITVYDAIYINGLRVDNELLLTVVP